MSLGEGMEVFPCCRLYFLLIASTHTQQKERECPRLRPVNIYTSLDGAIKKLSHYHT